ncbi:helix-turn-helix domain-containing protein [Polymorphobacter sp.]|uniref:helix-turn-helix domain-containing protein n=1 Tax=Polymorphobacter sp. TaxID=1909290 RepID=UPI003F7282EB
MSGVQTSSPVVAELIAVIGEEAYFELGRAAGGSMFYVPRHFPDGHWLVKAIGRTAAELLSEYFHGTYLVLPVREWRRFAIARLAERGFSGDTIARELRLSRSSVYEALAGARDQREPSLFD